MNIRLRHDWVRVVVEPEKKVSDGGIFLPGVQPIRIARVVAVGPGRQFRSGAFIPMELKVGDRFHFFKGASETRQGHALALLLDENEALLRETDVLSVIDEGSPEMTL